MNGVSAEFAKAHRNYRQDNKTNEGCFDCSGCGGCSDCYNCSNCSCCHNCYDCAVCYRCSRCSRCYRCNRCYRCSRCESKSDSGPTKTAFSIPVIRGIHNQILRAVSASHALEMGDWHTCETTHCRAGWVVSLAGTAGRVLERQTSTLFAAMQIYNKSSPIPCHSHHFFESNEVAMADIRRCAELEMAAV